MCSVSDRECRDRRCQSVPLVDGTPVHRGSISNASRKARAHALKIASLMWWVLRPWCKITCRFIRPWVQTACQKSATSSLSNSPILGDGMATFQTQKARPPGRRQPSPGPRPWEGRHGRTA